MNSKKKSNLMSIPDYLKGYIKTKKTKKEKLSETLKEPRDCYISDASQDAYQASVRAYIVSRVYVQELVIDEKTKENPEYLFMFIIKENEWNTINQINIYGDIINEKGENKIEIYFNTDLRMLTMLAKLKKIKYFDTDLRMLTMLAKLKKIDEETNTMLLKTMKNNKWMKCSVGSDYKIRALHIDERKRLKLMQDLKIYCYDEIEYRKWMLKGPLYKKYIGNDEKLKEEIKKIDTMSNKEIRNKSYNFNEEGFEKWLKKDNAGKLYRSRQEKCIKIEYKTIKSAFEYLFDLLRNDTDIIKTNQNLFSEFNKKAIEKKKKVERYKSTISKHLGHEAAPFIEKMTATEFLNWK